MGAGPAGLTAGRYLAEEGYDVVIFERKLTIGGGTWGGGMTFPIAVIQPKAADIVRENEVQLEKRGEYYLADSKELATKTAASTIDAGVRIFNHTTVVDVLIREGNVVKGVVVNSSSLLDVGRHVDPLSIKADIVIEASGHDCELLQVIHEKIPDAEKHLVSDGIGKERPMWAERGEAVIKENTKEIYPGVIVAGMAANAAFRSPRMGTIFGGMFLSGKKAAKEAKKKL